MTAALAAVIGYLIGSVPTAVWVTRAMGHDIRHEGSGNPGTANALGVAGPKAAAAVLGPDVVKGAAAVLIGRSLGGDAAGLVAAFSVILGQVVNVWLGLRGGKGLGVGLGSTLVHWPFGVVVLLPTLALAAKLSRSAARGALITLAATLVVVPIAVAASLPNAWGIDVTWALLGWAGPTVALLIPKFVLDVRRDRASRAAPDPVA